MKKATWTNAFLWITIPLLVILLACGGAYKSLSPQAQYDTVSVLKEFFGSPSPIKSDKPLMEDIYYWTNSPEYWELQKARSERVREDRETNPEKYKALEAQLRALQPKD